MHWAYHLPSHLFTPSVLYICVYLFIFNCCYVYVLSPSSLSLFYFPTTFPHPLSHFLDLNSILIMLTLSLNEDGRHHTLAVIPPPCRWGHSATKHARLITGAAQVAAPRHLLNGNDPTAACSLSPWRDRSWSKHSSHYTQVRVRFDYCSSPRLFIYMAFKNWASLKLH